MPANGYLRNPVVIGCTPKTRLGVLLNLVDRPAFPCPECDTGGPLAVYVPAVRWPCGHTRSLPPIHTNSRPAQQPLYLIRSVA
jgi:hypothetical protein